RRGAASRDQVDREVQVDVVALREPYRVPTGIARALELLGAPLLDPFELRVVSKVGLRRSHIRRFGHRTISVVPFPGGCGQTEVQFVTPPRETGHSSTSASASPTPRRRR